MRVLDAFVAEGTKVRCRQNAPPSDAAHGVPPAKRCEAKFLIAKDIAVGEVLSDVLRNTQVQCLSPKLRRSELHCGGLAGNIWSDGRPAGRRGNVDAGRSCRRR